MAHTLVRPAEGSDLARLTEIYNHYVVSSPVTFDLEPLTVQQRLVWFRAHSNIGRHRLLVADEEGLLVGYATTSQFRDRAAYNTTVEASVYCAPDAVGRGIGSALYHALFTAIALEEINRIVAGITLPNPASIALHRSFGFVEVGVFTQAGRKFNRYWDVAWYERPLSQSTAKPGPGAKPC
jgi:phosphinothricin acetyltransferase